MNEEIEKLEREKKDLEKKLEETTRKLAQAEASATSAGIDSVSLNGTSQRE